MRKTELLPLLALAAGAVGFAIRRWNVTAAFEPSGLATPGHPSTYALVSFTVVAAVALILLARLLRGKKETDGSALTYAQAFRLPGVVSLILSVAAAFAYLGAGFLTLRDYMLQRTQALLTPEAGFGLQLSITGLLMALFSLAACVSMIFLAARNYKGYRGDGSFSLAPLVPAFFACFWLIDAYRVKAADPVVLAYCFHFLAIMTVMLAFYYSAALSYRSPRQGRALCLSLLAVQLCLTALGDLPSGGQCLLLAGSALWHLVSADSLVIALSGNPPPAPVPEKPQTEENGDDDVDIVL